MFLRQHRRMVLDYLGLYGRDATKLEFNMGDDALDRLIASESAENPAFEIASKALARVELNEAKVSDLVKLVRELQNAVEQLPASLSAELGRQLFMPAISRAMPPLPARDGLDINAQISAAKRKPGP